MNNYFADMHCHPTIQPYANAFPPKDQLQTKMDIIQSGDIKNKSSLWFYNPPTIEERILKDTLGITRYSQSDFTSLVKGNVRLIFSSLNPIEKGFFINKLGTGHLSNEIKEFFSGVNENRIEYVIKYTDYFSDLCSEYDFLKQKSGKNVIIDKNICNYILAKNASEIDNAIKDSKTYSIAVVNTLEGLHSFGSGLYTDVPFSSRDILSNIAIAKNWEHHPLFVTFTHHFYNELCGQCESLHKIRLLVDQKMGMGSDYNFTPFGLDVIDILLNKTDGKRILIDVKHMSRTTRKRFYNILETKYKTENIPIIASHAAVAGNNNNIFCDDDINFDCDEIIKIKETQGLFGIMLDKNRIAAPGALPTIIEDIVAGKKLWSKLVWNQIEFIAKHLDRNGFDGAWDIQCIGSDFDGIINPINHFITAEDMPDFSEQLINHAENFMNRDGGNMRSANKLNPNTIIDNVMFSNAYNFAISNY
jgi:microsomal dipeptidase-like Zn-dependent dipeptidase